MYAIENHDLGKNMKSQNVIACISGQACETVHSFRIRQEQGDNTPFRDIL